MVTLPAIHAVLACFWQGRSPEANPCVAMQAAWLAEKSLLECKVHQLEEGGLHTACIWRSLCNAVLSAITPGCVV